MTEIKTLVIDRQYWQRGQGGDASKLLTLQGKMCCLGFLGSACGIPDNYLRGFGTPASVRNAGERGKFPDGFLIESWTSECGENTTLTRQLVTLNDRCGMPEEEREREIILLFASAGIEVTFIN